MLALKGVTLVPWQRDAVAAWEAGSGAPHRGTLEVFTGGGKSLIALACAARAAETHPDLRVAIVVPTEALAHQWRSVVTTHTNVDAAEIGLLGAGGKGDLTTNRVLIAVLNTAAKRLPTLASNAQPVMLIIDECHRAGAPGFSKVLSTPAQFRLGLSATPEREEFDEDGEPLNYDEQLLGRLLGPIVYRFGLRDVRNIGWLPDYTVHHHGISLRPDERNEYDVVSRRITEAADEMRACGGDSARARQFQRRDDELGAAARAYIGLTAERKDLLYRAAERARVAAAVVEQATADTRRKVLLFHERVDEAAALADEIGLRLGTERVGLEHSRLSDTERAVALNAFRDGSRPVLVSVKSLVEGIDVPDAEVGISVAASSSVRQRIQSLGRVLRRRFDEAESDAHKTAEMHLIYVADTVDESIYSKEDWGDLTGEAVNHYWRWSLDNELPPERLDGPPATPRPTEQAEWERLGGTAPLTPVPWLGSFIGQEYSIDTMGNITNRSRALIVNPQGVDEMFHAVRGRVGGRFRVTPVHRIVLITGGDGEGQLFAAGALSEPFEIEALAEHQSPGEREPIDTQALSPGDPYPGPIDKDHGTFRTRARRGGIIERPIQGGAVYAETSGDNDDQLVANAQQLLTAWKAAVKRGIEFHVNHLDHAWFTEKGTRRFLANVPGGFRWPVEEQTNDNDLPRASTLKREQGREVQDQARQERLGSEPCLPLE